MKNVTCKNRTYTHIVLQFKDLHLNNPVSHNMNIKTVYDGFKIDMFNMAKYIGDRYILLLSKTWEGREDGCKIRERLDGRNKE